MRVEKIEHQYGDFYIGAGVCTSADIILPIDSLRGIPVEAIGPIVSDLMLDIGDLAVEYYCEQASYYYPNIYRLDVDELRHALLFFCKFSETNDKALEWVEKLIDVLIGKVSKTENKEQTKAPGAGFVYILKVGKHYKIGQSINPQRRARELAAGLPFDLIHTIGTEDMSRLEIELHTKFEEKCISGEWFELEAEDIEWLKTL